MLMHPRRGRAVPKRFFTVARIAKNLACMVQFEHVSFCFKMLVTY